ncbi:TetR/AcrR family transcriptional regulator [Tersicoccus sp. Bi-70]|uniref:TetR/AcrR family transcriptional regulator n=1 Tax=Tersicoccus sp. Bi-70 TaxID=1897634 RepID=UPI00097568AF|nr:TetR/AcrR family transcriptional regulator [Tersicoccus sp. Bi-70]OMH34832.1 TetR family transcriptional regulator [Tersicoccus sp. Bi-70]
MSSVDHSLPARERLIQAATTLLTQAQGGPVSTRQITDLAGVKAPTLYHHFGDKEGLLDAVVARGFEQYLARERGLSVSADPVEDVRRFWDAHVQFGLEQPDVYSVMFGNVRPEQRPAIVIETEAVLEGILQNAARQGLLVVPPRQAARSILAANVGVTLMLIAEPAQRRSMGLSELSRDGAISAVLSDGAATRSDPDNPEQPSYVVAAIALNATLQASHPEQLSSSEMRLFLEWLQRMTHPTTT